MLKSTLSSYSQKDGTKSVRIYLNNYGKHSYYTLLNLYCTEKDFDRKSGRIKKSRENYTEINSIISIAVSKFEELLLKNPNCTPNEIIIMYEGGKQLPSEGKLIPFAEYFYYECKDGKINRSPQTFKKYLTIINHLKNFNPEIKFSDINKNFYHSFTSYLRNDIKQMENSIGSAIKVIKVFMVEAFDRGLTDNQEFKKKYFKTIQEETDQIYLTEEELQRIIDLDLSKHPTHAEERDRFIISCYLMLRWSDSIRINQANFYSKDGMTIFRQRNQKTGIEVYVPVKKIVTEILSRNNYAIDFTENNKANLHLKDIGRLAKIDEEVFMNGELYKKYELITTHTARRSRATNLYLSGIDLKTIKELGGWEKEETVVKYIRVSKLDMAIKMGNHPAFS